MAFSLASRKQSLVICSLIFLYFALLLFYVIMTQRGVHFDDAFITYRYARNLADGAGITWNIGQRPTEGYTNFLLVILLAPFIRLGLDPFWLTRFLNILAILASAVVLFNIGREYFQMNRVSAFLAAVIMLHPIGAYAAMLGLETCLYTFALLLVLFYYNSYLTKKNKRYLLYFGLSSLAVFWLRPEGMLLVIICLANFFWHRRSLDWREIGSALLPAFFLPLIVYLVWKYWYFGDLFPNPYYLKVSGSFFSDLGYKSVSKYLTLMSPLLILGLISFFLEESRNTLMVVTAIFVLVNILFFLRVDTIMDYHNRFLYPLTPMLVVLALPVLKIGFEGVGRNQGNIIVKMVVLVLFFTIIIGRDYDAKDRFFVFTLSKMKMMKTPVNIFYKEYLVANQLARYPGIRNLKIAIPDAGLIPYYTRAQVLDVVGLNDTFISREKNLGKLINYYLDQKPDLAFMPARANWLRIGHGPLGDYSVLARDSRWADYTYAGTVNVIYYYYHLFVRNNYLKSKQLRNFLRLYVVERYLDPFPLPMGGGKSR